VLLVGLAFGMGIMFPKIGGVRKHRRLAS
jgi:hypothetical protein